MTAPAFQLTKWYFDLVTDDGAVAVAYAARLGIEGLWMSYASVFLSRPSGPDAETATLRGVTWPSLTDDTCVWRNRQLDIDARWHREAPAIERTLVDSADGSIRWTCHMPRARAEMRHRALSLRGIGYVECLRMTIAPWKLPFHTLRWGRHASNRHSLVWIEWDDGAAGRWIWLNGEEEPGARLTEAGVVGISGNREVHLHGTRDVRNRGVLPGISGIVPALRRHVIGTLAGMHERKLLSRSTLLESGHAMDGGTTVHEVVRW